MANKRPFTYDKLDKFQTIETAKNSQGDVVYIEMTSPLFVNIGFDRVQLNRPNVEKAPYGPGWTSVARGPMLDDLITALTYYRDIGYKEL